MPRGMYKSKTFRKAFVKAPGGNVHVQYRRRKPAKAHCAECGKVLAGVPRELPRKMHNLSKSEKRPERPYGGKLCSACMRRLMINSVRY